MLAVCASLGARDADSGGAQEACTSLLYCTVQEAYTALLYCTVQEAYTALLYCTVQEPAPLAEAQGERPSH